MKIPYNEAMNTRSLSNYVTLFLAFLGAGIASLLTYEHFSPSFNLPCGMVGGGCKGTLQSSYGHVGPIPTAVFGLGMYLLLIALCFIRKKRLEAVRTAEAARAAAYATAGASTEESAPATDETPVGDMAPPAPAPVVLEDLTAPAYAALNQVNMAIWGLALAGIAISWWLQYTALFVIQSFCPYCFSSAVLITLIFLLASRDYLIEGRKLTGEQKMLAAVLGFIAVMMGFMYLPTVMEQFRKIQLGIAMTEVKDRGEGTSSPLPRDKIVRADMHVKGDPNAPFLLVEFADYMCPGCKEASGKLDEYLKDPEMKKKFRLAFRNFPLPIPTHRWSMQAAQAAEAAGAQGKFWEMHDYLFAHQEMLESPGFTADRFEDFARAVGLDVERFKQAMASEEFKARCEQDREDAKAGGASMTPTFFLVTPKKVWSFAGVAKLTEVMDNPKHEVWKQ